MSFIVKDKSGAWRARYRDPSGRARSRNFARKADAAAFLTSVEHGKLSGAYIDPAAGRVTFGEYAKGWQAGQVHRPATALVIDSHLRNHVLPVFGDRPVAGIRPSELQAWIRALADVLSAGSVRVVAQHTSAVFKAAVTDRVIAVNPCQGLKLPKVELRRVEPLTTEQVLALLDAMPDRYRGLGALGAGAGLRQGEAVGVTFDEVDFLRRSLTVKHQLVSMPCQPDCLAPPKTDSSIRTIPLPDFVTTALARHLENYEPGVHGLLFTQPSGLPVSRNRFGDEWRATVKRAGLPPGTRYHDLRHFYASLLIRHGESVKTVQVRLGHASARETLDTYSHLWPDSEDRTRAAVDAVLSDSALATPGAVEATSPE